MATWTGFSVNEIKQNVTWAVVFACTCAVLLCLVCLFDLACFFLSSFSSLIKNMYMYMYIPAPKFKVSMSFIATFLPQMGLCKHIPGGKVRAISRGDLARGDIARDPVRSRQIPWFRVRLREIIERREATGLRAISHAYN